MKFPDMLPTVRPHVSLERLTRTNAGAYLLAVQANQDYLKRHYIPGPARKPKARMDELRDMITGLLDSETLDMGIWHRDIFVGGASLTSDKAAQEAEVGCWLSESQSGRGYASCALQAIADYGRENYPRVVARVAEDNAASIKLVERCGFSVAQQLGRVLVFELADNK